MGITTAPARTRTAAALLAAGLLLAAPACTWGRPKPPPTTGGPRPTGPVVTTPRPTRPDPTTPPTTINPPDAAGWRGEMLGLVNAERAKANLQPMVLCGTLDRAAQAYAEDMARRNVMTHTGADGSTPFQRIQAAGYVSAGRGYLAGAENIAQGYPSVAAVMTGWMNSSGHRANILASATNHVGFGRQGAFWVQNFGAGGTC
jgi:uncharacterized protein YkwD